MSTPSHRYPYIDLLRGLAVVVMIEVHIFNEWLHPDLKENTLWYVLNFFNGLVAPTFVFLAGFSFSLAAKRKLQEFTTWSPALRSRLRHLAFILVVGYILHIPAYSYRTLKYWSTPDSLQGFWIVDVLHLIVAGLLFLHLLFFISKSRKVVVHASMILGFIFFFGTPWANQTAIFDVLPRWLGNYFVNRHGSLFPLFPWGGFLFLGAAFSDYVIMHQGKNQGLTSLRGMALLGSLFLFIGMLTDIIPFFHYYEGYIYWKNSPQFSLVRVGSVLLLLYLVAWLELRRKWTSKALVLMGQESLLVYAFHLLILFAKTPKSLAETYAGQFSYWECLAAYLVMAAGMYLTARVWHALKKRSMTKARLVLGCIIVIAIFVFFFFENGGIVLWILNPNDPFK